MDNFGQVTVFFEALPFVVEEHENSFIIMVVMLPATGLTAKSLLDDTLMQGLKKHIFKIF